jgi:glycosyltransferase involved in cell wall biosynthesis
MKISFLIPVLNYEPTLAETVQRLRDVCTSEEAEILIVFDVTRPECLGQVEPQRADLTTKFDARSFVRLNERGFGSALRYAADQARGDVVVPIMADLSDDVSVVPAMRERISAGADVVAGARYIKGGRIVGDTPKQRLSLLYSWLIVAMSEIKCRDISNSFKMYRRDVWQAVNAQAGSFDLSAELTVKAAVLGYRVEQLPATWVNRQVGKSNFRLVRELWHYGRWAAIGVLCLPARWLVVAGLGLPLFVKRVARRRIFASGHVRAAGSYATALLSDTAQGELDDR